MAISFEEFTRGKGAKKQATTTPAVTKKPGFFQDAAQDVKETGSAVKQSVANAFIGMGAAGDRYVNQDVQNTGGKTTNPLSALTQMFGAGAKGVSDVLGDLTVGAGKVALPQRTEEAIGRGVQRTVATARDVAEPVTRPLGAAYGRFADANPEAAENIKAGGQTALLGLDIATAGVGGRGVGVASRALKEGAEATLETAGRAARGTMEAPRKISSKLLQEGSVARDATEFGTQQVTGLNLSTIKTVLEAPDAFKAAQDAGLDKLSIAKSLKEGVDNLRAETSEISKAYGPLRQSGQRVKLPEDFLTQQIAKQGYDVVDGKITATSKSKSRDPGDVRALQYLYDNWSGRGELDADEFLNFRSDLAELAKYDRMSGKSADIEAMTREFRKELNTVGRPQVKGLDKLDADMTERKRVLDDIDNILFDKEGNLRDQDINKIFAAGNPGRETRLDVLKTIDPEIEAKLKLARAVSDVEDAMGNKVGTYIRAGFGIGAGIAVNPIVGFIAFLATNPKTFVRFLQWTAKRFPSLQDNLTSAAKKVQTGDKLNVAENDAVKIAISQQKEVAQEFIKTEEATEVPTASIQKLGSASKSTLQPTKNEPVSSSKDTTKQGVVGQLVDRYKNTPGKEGGYVSIGGKTIREIDDPTKREIMSLIDYLRVEKGDPKKMEQVFDALTSKFNIDPNWSNSRIANTLEDLLDKTKTRG